MPLPNRRRTRMSKKIRIFVKSKPQVKVVPTGENVGENGYPYVVVIEDHGWGMVEL